MKLKSILYQPGK